MHLQNSLTQWIFRAVSWIFRAEVCAKARNKRKGRNILTLSGRLKNVFSGKQLGLGQEETLVVFLHTHATGGPWRQRGMKWRYARNSHLEQAYSSLPKVKKQTDGKKLEQSKGQSWKNSLSMMGKMKKIVAWLPTSSRVSWLQVWKQMHSWLSLPIWTCWRWEATSARGREKKVLKDKLLFWGKKESKVLYLKTQIPWMLSSTESWRIGIERFGTHHEILRMHLVQDWIRERKKQSGGIIQKGWTSWAKSLRAQFGGTTTWGNLTTSRLYQQRSVEFGEKICKLKPKTTTFYSPVKAPETQKIVCLLWIRELQCTMLSKENWAQIQWILWEGPKTPYATNRDRVQCK